MSSKIFDNNVLTVDTKHKISPLGVICGRIKVKQLKKLNIFDVLMIKKLSLITEKIYFYLDDRSLGIHEKHKVIDNYLNMLRKFDIKYPDSILFYSDYYRIARAYIYYLIKKKQAVLNYNTTHKNSDLFTFMRDANIKVFFDTPTLRTTICDFTNMNTKICNNDDNNNKMYSDDEIKDLEKRNICVDKKKCDYFDRYDYILYDNGWYRDIFIETIMDDSEMIDYILIDHDISSNAMNDISIGMINSKEQLRTYLLNALNFHRPDTVFTEFIDNISRIKTKTIAMTMPFELHRRSMFRDNPNGSTDTDKEHCNKLLLTDISLDQIFDVGITLSMVDTMIKKNNMSLDEYIVDCDVRYDRSIMNQANEGTNNVHVDTNVLTDPLVINLTKTKTIMGYNIKTIYVDRDELIFLGIDIGSIDDVAGIVFRLKNIGSIHVFLDGQNNVEKTDLNRSQMFQGFFVGTKKKSKKKKRSINQKTCANYIINYEPDKNTFNTSSVSVPREIELSKYNSFIDTIKIPNKNNVTRSIVFIKNKFTYSNVFKVDGNYYLITPPNNITKLK